MTEIVVERRTAPPAAFAMTPRAFEVVSKRAELDDCATLEMAAVDGAPFAFAPGQFTMLYVHGVGEVAISVSGDPATPERLVQTIRGVGPVSRAICGLGIGDRIGVRGPLGVPWPVERALGRRLMIVAGGLGLAPTRPIVYWALAHLDRLQGVDLLYGARSPDQILYAEELSRWAATDGVRVAISVDRATGDWEGRVGVVTDVISEARVDPEETVAMVCGPEIMMRFAAAARETAGARADAIFLSLERNMKCGVGWCGHCQLGPHLLCRDGPVFAYPAVRDLMRIREL